MSPTGDVEQTSHERDGVWWWPGAVVLVLVVPVLVLVVALVNQRPTPPTIGRAAVLASDAAGPSSSSSPSATPTVGPEDPPQVKSLRHANFAQGHGLPDGGRLYDAGKSTSGMKLAGDVLTHGAPTTGAAAGYLETKLGQPVRKLGVRVRFASEDPATDGGVAITAWQSSVEKSLQAGNGLPPSGMRLVVRDGSWSLVAIVKGKPVLIQKGTYRASDVGSRPQRFSLIRSDDQVWVRDPLGGITYVTDQRAAELAGPWASWELYERKPGDKPASIVDVWAG